MLFISQLNNAQNISKQAEAFISEKVQKNIAAYNLKYGDITLNGILPNNKLVLESSFFYDAFLPDEGFKMQMSIEKIDWEYPIKGYVVYKIYMKQIVHINEKTGDERKFFDKWTNPYFLVALDENEQKWKIKFISGQFFTHSIKGDFPIDISNPLSYFDFLKYKMFKYQITDLSFDKKGKEKIYFKGYSNYLNKKVNIILDYKQSEDSIIVK